MLTRMVGIVALVLVLAALTVTALAGPNPVPIVSSSRVTPTEFLPWLE